ncbi:hypothetical protein M8818_001145 [Zalaria obscura]|uniref:Uncharacterized protein n=1 Tax=Zalaria obscura TaxID=2024903 RepID=A0ACC3SKU7_9PEZI
MPCERLLLEGLFLSGAGIQLVWPVFGHGEGETLICIAETDMIEAMVPQMRKSLVKRRAYILGVEEENQVVEVRPPFWGMWSVRRCGALLDPPSNVAAATVSCRRPSATRVMGCMQQARTPWIFSLPALALRTATHVRPSTNRSPEAMREVKCTRSTPYSISILAGVPSRVREQD